MEQKEFKVGDTVYSTIYEGKGRVIEIVKESHPVKVVFDELDIVRYFTNDGRFDEAGLCVLFHEPPTISFFKIKPRLTYSQGLIALYDGKTLSYDFLKFKLIKGEINISMINEDKYERMTIPFSKYKENTFELID